MTIGLALVLTGCEASGGPDTTPEAVGTDAPTYPLDGVALPGEFGSARVVDPGWQSSPQSHGGMFLGFHEGRSALEFTTVAESGAVVWRAERPKACSGFVVTTDGERSIAVLMDLESTDDALAAATATAYDIHTGRQLWGPTSVPGPLRGPGLVFAAPPTDYLGATGPAVALDPATGGVVVDEQAVDSRIIGEFGGTVLVDDEHELEARTAAGGITPVWARPHALTGLHPDRITVERSNDPVSSVVLLGGGDDGYRLVDLRDGSIIATGLRDAVTDHATGTHITLGDQLRAYDSEGRVVWALDTTATSIEAAGRGLVHTRGQHGVETHHVDTGAVGETLPGDVTVPEHVGPAGAGVIGLPDRFLLLTTKPR